MTDSHYRITNTPAPVFTQIITLVVLLIQQVKCKYHSGQSFQLHNNYGIRPLIHYQVD